MAKKIKTWDDIEDQNLVSKVFNSEEFREGFRKLIEADTWDKGRPKVYMDKDGWIVKHWKDGTIKRLKKVKK